MMILVNRKLIYLSWQAKKKYTQKISILVVIAFFGPCHYKARSLKQGIERKRKKVEIK